MVTTNNRLKHERGKKVKVAFFTDMLVRNFDGAAKTMYQLIDRIPGESFEYLFFCGIPPENSPKLRYVKVPAVTIFFNASYKAALPQFRKTDITTTMRRFKPDVIHISTPSPLGYFALQYAKKNNIPVLSIYHTHFISYMQYYFKYTPFLINFAESITAKVYKDFYNKCDLVYVPTTQMITELQSCGISGKKMKLWQRGLNLTLFNPSKENKSFVKDFTWNEKPNILFASRLVWEKNMETLFKIYDEMQVQKLNVNFIIAGNGVAEEAAREKMKNAIFLGFIDHETLSVVYASTDIFIFPSISESYGNVIVEAMASGCVPVIARGGGSQTLVKDGETGFLCEPGDAKDYVAKIKLLLNNETLKKKMQTAGYRYTSNLSWENLACEYFNDVASLAM